MDWPAAALGDVAVDDRRAIPIPVEMAPGVHLGAEPLYQPESLIPRGGWTACPDGPPTVADPSDRVILFDAPAEVLETFDKYGFFASATGLQGKVILGQPVFAPLCDTLWPLVSTVFEAQSFDDVIMSGIASARGEADTVSYNPETQRYTGVHVDSWDRDAMERRATSQGRMCINIGVAPRYLVFVNKSFARLSAEAQAAAWPDGPPRRYTQLVKDMVQDYYGHVPEAPIFRARLERGQGYICRTDNLIHDAMIDPGGLDVSFHIRGDLRQEPLRAAA